MAWYLVHTKPRQEHRALQNLERQGFECLLPILRREAIRQGRLTTVDEPLFGRYLFIRLTDELNWAPIRSTLGVNTLVRFGTQPARVPDDLVASLREARAAAASQPAQPLFLPGQVVRITQGPFAGLEGVFTMADGEARAMVLVELLSKAVRLPVLIGGLKAVDPQASVP